MSPRPTGRVVSTPAGVDLVLERQFRAPIEDVWKSVTESESLSRWFGTWSGDAGPGKHVTLQMGFEKDAPPSQVLIETCEAPHHLAVHMKDDHGEWRLEALLSQAGDVTTLRFVQRSVKPEDVASVGPGWEYYLDMLVAARAGASLPDFGDYYPAMKEHFAAQLPPAK
ncbi:MAG: hypothetical protein K0R38_4636 [Polyangiaceae bacterium]|nr:hypothetical protein [Polyangiaceae bacterium]